MRLAILAAGAAALSLSASEPASGQPSNGGWWYAGQSGQAPNRQLIFMDRSTMRRAGDSASTRVMIVFERPRGEVRGFAITYEFQCGAKRIQSRDALFTTTANMIETENGIVDQWSPAVSGSVAFLVLAATCYDRFDSAARQIVGAPLVEAERMFQSAAALANLGRAPTREDCLAMPEPEGSECVGVVGGAALARLDAVLPRQRSQCSGDVYADGREAGRFAVSLSFSDRQGTLRFQPDPYRLSGRYRAQLAGDSIELLLPNNIVANYSPVHSQLRMRFVWRWTSEEYMGPQAGLANAGNPFAPVEVGQSARIELLGRCS